MSAWRGNQGQNQNKPAQGQDQLVDDVQGNIRKRTHLIQLYTNDPDEGPRLISDKNEKGVPIMVIVDPPSCCYFKLNVPHGIVTLEHIWGKKQGMMDPGYYCCYCSYKRIAAMITKNAILFNTPIEGCPTKDNVKVSVDIGITFHIGKEETRQEDCEKFLYQLGANKLEELLQQECEETIRNYIRRIKVSKIRDIKSELTSTLSGDLNDRFRRFGIYIDQVNVTNVIIPRDLRYALQTATTYDVLLQQQVKLQENTIIRMMNENDKAMLTLKRENQMKLNQLVHQLAMEEIQLEKVKVSTETDQKVAVIKAQEKQSIKIIQADAFKAQAEQRAKKQAEQILAEAKAYAEGKLAETNAQKEALKVRADVRLQSAQLRQQGVMAEAEAENAQAANLDPKRKFEQRIKMADSLQQMIRNNKIIISGESGENLLGFFKDTTDLVNLMQNE